MSLRDLRRQILRPGPATLLVSVVLTVGATFAYFVGGWVVSEQYAAAFTTALALGIGFSCGWSARSIRRYWQEVGPALGADFTGRKGLLWAAAGTLLIGIGAAPGVMQTRPSQGLLGGAFGLVIWLLLTLKRVAGRASLIDARIASRREIGL